MARTTDRATDLEEGRAQGPLRVWPWRHRSLLYPRTPQTPSCTWSCCSSSGSRQACAQGGPGEARQGEPEPPSGAPGTCTSSRREPRFPRAGGPQHPEERSLKQE